LLRAYAIDCPRCSCWIFENRHQRALLRHVSSEQSDRGLQVVVGKCRNRFLQIEVRSLQSFRHFLRIGDGRGRCPSIRCARKHAGEQAVLFNDQVEDVGEVSVLISTVGLPENKNGYSIHDLWSGETKKTSSIISAVDPSHGVVLCRVTGL